MLIWLAKQELGLSFLFISHDMAVVRNGSATMSAIMYLGRMREMGTRAQVFRKQPQHPFIPQALMKAVPIA